MPDGSASLESALAIMPTAPACPIALGALDVELRPDDLAQIEQAIPADAAAGERYQAEQMAILDSERG
jgi:hypothetical protein